MTLKEIKKAVDNDKIVHWKNSGYMVIGVDGDYQIGYRQNKCFIGLTWNDGKTLNGDESDFYVA